MKATILRTNLRTAPRTNATGLIWGLGVALVLAGATMAHAAAPVTLGIEVTISGPACPYETARLEAVIKRGASIAGFSRRFKAPFGHQEGVGLVTIPDLRALMSGLAAQGLFRLVDDRHEGYRLRYRITAVGVDGVRTDVVVDDPWQSGQPALLRVVEHLRSFVGGVTAAPTFVDPMLLKSESGTLRIRSKPPARVWLDEVPLAGQTPIGGLRVREGKHKARLSTLDGVLSEEYEVSVEIGKLTSLEVTLSPPPVDGENREPDDPR